MVHPAGKNRSAQFPSSSGIAIALFEVFAEPHGNCQGNKS